MVFMPQFNVNSLCIRLRGTLRGRLSGSDDMERGQVGSHKAYNKYLIDQHQLK